MANSCSEFEGKSTCERAAVASVEEASGKASEPASGHSALSEVPGDGTRSEVEMKLATPSDKAERGSSENAPVSKDKAADVHNDSAQDASTLALGVGQAEDTTGENQNGKPATRVCAFAAAKYAKVGTGPPSDA